MQRISWRAAGWLLIAVAVTWAVRETRGLASDQKDARAGRLIVHEWGTFTSLQDESGRSIPGVNSDDGPVPDFVHRLADLVPKPTELAPIYYKGIPAVHRDVVMRLETPVIYFYPPADARLPMQIDVDVKFRGGWLSEYYPKALADAPGFDQRRPRFGRIRPDAVGSLQWNDLTVGGGGTAPETDAPVWLAPRKVKAAMVKAVSGEAERYLFYRGVGNLVAPVNVSREGAQGDLLIREQLDPALRLKGPLEIAAMWLVHVREDGVVAYRPIAPGRLSGEKGHLLAQTAAEFAQEDFSPERLAQLRADMGRALRDDGLYADEAEAMLKTWELAYFKTAGLRLFFVLPKPWTNAVMPLKVSVPTEVSRTMVGRIEIVTPKQRESLRRISQGPHSSSNWFNGLYAEDKRAALEAVWSGRLPLSKSDLPIPGDYRAYLELGRFRNVLILDEAAHNASSGMTKFMNGYDISYFDPEE